MAIIQRTYPPPLSHSPLTHPPHHISHCTHYYLPINVYECGFWGKYIECNIAFYVNYVNLILLGKKNMPHAQQTMTDVIIESPSIQISEYLVPTAAPTAVLSPQRERQTADKCNNPVYMTHVRQERTSFWLAQQQRRSRVSDLEHSYETTTHDYEDIFMGSFNGGNSICMNSNEAYYYINALESI